MKIYRISMQNIDLWLDDNRDPSDPKIQKLFGSKGTEVWVKTVPEAKVYLSQGIVASISFDNDLGTPEEGRHLADWIEEKAYNKEIPRMVWRVHSANVDASPRIQAAMRNAERFWED